MVREVAVNRLHVAGRSERQLKQLFNKQTEILGAMRALRHPHLIGALAAYKRGTDWCSVLPWPSGGNLRDLWRREPGPVSQELRLWAWKQIRGLTDGLDSLHERGLCHGDVKPENIFVFGARRGSGPGKLVIADVGMGNLHVDSTHERQAGGDSNTIMYGTVRYEPPEIESKSEQMSYRYDSWSLGCVILEFLIWVLRGSEGQERFNAELVEAGPDFDRFWHRQSRQRPVLNPVVQTWIYEELPRDPAASPALRDLINLVASQLLVVSVYSRKYLGNFYEHLLKVEDKYLDDPSYMWSEPVADQTSHRQTVVGAP